MEWLFDNTQDTFSINIGDFIVARSILLADITEATFLVKTSRCDEDVNAVVTLTLGSGLTKSAGATESDARLIAQFSSSDFGAGKLEVNLNFLTGVGIKTVSMTKFLEIPLVDSTLRITQDFIHD